MSDKTDYTAENIAKLNLKDHVRTRPGMYLGRVDLKGFIDIMSGIFCDAIEDTSLKNELTIKITSQKSGQLILTNNQKQLVDKWNPDVKNLHHNTRNLYYLNIQILNSLSNHFEVSLHNSNNEVISKEKYSEGKRTTEPINNFTANKIVIDFELDNKIWGEDFTISEFYLNHRLRELAFLNKDAKIKIQYKVDGEDCKVVHHFKNGLKDRVIIEQLNGLGKCYFETYINEEINEFHIEVAFGFREYTVDEPFLRSYANNFYTSEDGTHVDGVLNGLTYGVMKYFQKYDLVDKYKISEKGMREHLICAIHIKLDNPMFSGCVKNKLSNPDIIEPIASRISEILFNKIEQNEESTNKLISKFEI